MDILLPDEVRYIIDTLGNSGYEAYAVGGCIRDRLLGGNPHDWDICTPSLPEQTRACFAGHHIIETGLRHGTLTIILDHKPFEVTTFRVDGKYTDNRRPDDVRFVNVLKRDLARRDFTVNAMAYNPKIGLIDYYGGRQDLAGKIIKCVGNPDKRFSEDALRIMRALRFAAVLGFSVGDETARAMHDNRKLLKNIAAERIAAELNKMITGDGAGAVLSAHLPVLLEIIPEFECAADFARNNPHNCGVLRHTLRSVDAAPRDTVIRLTMLLHDIAVPKRYAESDGMRFHGHSRECPVMAGEILSRLKYDGDTIKAVTELVLYRDCGIENKRDIKRSLNKIGEERFRQLLDVKRADAMARIADAGEGNDPGNELKNISGAAVLLDEIIAQKQCFLLKDLAVNGKDLIDAGIPRGPGIGAVLKRLMDMVIDEEAENDREGLLEIACKLGEGG